MPTNESVTSSLSFPGQVPPDQECNISNLSAILRGAVSYLSIQTSNPDGTPTPPDDSVAQQALSTANAALAAVQALTAAQKQSRTVNPQPMPTGDGLFSVAFSTPMPSVNYNVFATIYAGADTHPAGNNMYGLRVLESSITVNGFTLLVDNVPANSKVGVFAIER